MDEQQRAAEREIEDAIQQAIARFGAAGTVSIVGSEVLLEGHGDRVTTPLGSLAEAWARLASEVRQKRCVSLARELVSRRRAVNASTLPQRSSARDWLTFGAVLVAATIALGVARILIGPPSDEANRAQMHGNSHGAMTPLRVDRYEADRDARAARVCASTQARVERGATVSPLDVDGWVVEVSLLRAPPTPALANDPGLAEFVARPAGSTRGRFVWRSANWIADLEGPTTDVLVNDSSLGGLRPLSGLTLSFAGRYVGPYFSEEQRPQFVQAATAMAERVGARYAGLYARCATDTAHQLGAWFQGPGPSGAATALLYLVGSYARLPHFSLLTTTPDGAALDRSALVDVLAQRAAPLTRERVLQLIGAHGGMLAGRSEGPTAIIFPFRDGNRAARASREIARALGLR